MSNAQKISYNPKDYCPESRAVGNEITSLRDFFCKYVLLPPDRDPKYFEPIDQSYCLPNSIGKESSIQVTPIIQENVLSQEHDSPVLPPEKTFLSRIISQSTDQNENEIKRRKFTTGPIDFPSESDFLPSQPIHHVPDVPYSVHSSVSLLSNASDSLQSYSPDRASNNDESNQAKRFKIYSPPIDSDSSVCGNKKEKLKPKRVTMTLNPKTKQMSKKGTTPHWSRGEVQFLLESVRKYGKNFEKILELHSKIICFPTRTLKGISLKFRKLQLN